LAAAVVCTACRVPDSPSRWHPNYAYLAGLPPVTFHYDHGVLAGSYPEGVETVTVGFEDVCAQLGHVCLCGAGGFKIAAKAVAALRGAGPPLERGEFILISSHDHTVSDVIAFVLGCPRRRDAARSQYFVDATLKPPRREYHYYIGYRPARTAVHVVYRKHLLTGHAEMDRLWQIELAFERDPQTVSAADIARYRRAMAKTVADVLFERVPGLISVEAIPYEQFEQRLRDVRSDRLGDGRERSADAPGRQPALGV